MSYNSNSVWLVKCDRCDKYFEQGDRGCPFCLLAIVEENLADARARLPEGMKHCTILFKECEQGHGRLAAINWIDHGCSTCRIQELEAKLWQAGKLKPAADESQNTEQLKIVREQRALIREIAAIVGYHGKQNRAELVRYLTTFRRERDGFLESLLDKDAIFRQIANLAFSQCSIDDPPQSEPVDDDEEDGQ